MNDELPKYPDYALRRRYGEVINERDELLDAIIHLLTLAGYPSPHELKRLIEKEG